MEDVHQPLRLPDSLNYLSDGPGPELLNDGRSSLPYSLNRHQTSNPWSNLDEAPDYEALQLSPLSTGASNMADVAKSEGQAKGRESPPKSPEPSPAAALHNPEDAKAAAKENQGLILNKITSESRHKKSSQTELTNDRKHSSETAKSCNCKKSKCLKLYCECFASGQYCAGCKCTECHNTSDYIKEKKAAITRISKKNPLGFIRRLPDNSGNQLVGCNCKKSECQRNYCSCYRNGLACTKLCKCVQCKNSLDSVDSEMSEN
eukprot:TRINITY_DN15408_c0_g1_i31.p1 TRINITY_DN15408_c0_g1~~TRINITY_DN15408_c0_g1_i31.p1  ORF type:complete len:261 (-),score=47.34 TRINITY_DN15408_c0_g1_i31:177-959(-)